MTNSKCLRTLLYVTFVVVCLQVSASAQTAEDKNKIASIAGNGSSVRWDVLAPNSGLTLTVSAPDGRVFQHEYKAGSTPEFNLTDKLGERLPDGVYSYELRLSPILSGAAKAKLASARGKDDDPEAERSSRKRVVPDALVHSGSFSIMNGTAVVGGAVEEESGARPTTKSMLLLPGSTAVSPVTKLGQHHPSLFPDDVIPDDLIVQGSACVGLDCVNGEVFGFDTIRMKENNTRLQFEDTSASGFPLNNWQIRANSSAAGAASFLAFVDQGASGNSETGTIVFEVDAGAPANAMKVSSSGRVGLRTATPSLDLHITTADTPAHRLEQTNAGGFTAQTWDIAGNEANFFVRDVTGGSRLPFRIRPGAPTSSIDISASGNVGIGTATPGTKVDIILANGDFLRITESGSATPNRVFLGDQTNAGYLDLRTSDGSIRTLLNAGQTSYINSNGGNVGIGTTAPTALLSVNGTANKPGGGSWDIFSDERLKNIKGGFNSGLQAVLKLQPIRYEYKRDNALGLKSEGEHIGFGAQALQRIIPEAVTTNQNGYLMVNNDPILWTMLNAIKEQQKEIEQLKGEIRQLRTASRRRR